MATERCRKAFSVVEVVLACGLFSLLSLVLAASFKQVSDLWRRTNARDEALKQLLLARTYLVRDLANSTSRAGTSATAQVGPNLGSGRDGDALTFLSSDSGNNDHNWNADLNSGEATLPVQVTYYCVIPNVPTPGGLVISAGAADGQGYEQQHPFKWLVRRVDPTPSAAPPAIDSAWTSWLTRPTSLTPVANQKVVCNQLLRFRVLQTAPVWTLELSAVGVTEARRRLRLGSVPLSQSPYTLVQRFSVTAQQ